MLTTLLASAVLAELILRRFNPIESVIYEIHPRYLYRLIPGSRRLFFRSPEDGGAKRVLVTINSGGFRGHELGRRKGRLRVIVYGDSFMMATSSPLDETFPEQLEKKLAAVLGRPIEAVNAGVAGYGPDQISLRIEDEIGPLAPDLLVVAIFAGNDFGDLVRNKIYRLDANGGLALNRYRLSAVQVENFPDKPWEVPRSMLVRGLQRLFEHPRAESPGTTPAGIEAYLRKSQAEYDDAVVAGDLEVSNLFGDTYSADVSLTPHAPSAQYGVAVMEGVLVRVAEVAASQGVPVLFVFIPAAIDACRGPQYEAWAQALAAFPEYRRDGLTSLLSRIAARNGLEYLDLFPPFEAAGADSLYFPRDQHWNAAGHELAAELAKNHVIVRGPVRRLTQD